MSIPLRTAVETRKLALLARVPFFGILLSYLRLEEQPAAWFEERGLFATACTDGERIVYCREWFEDLLRTDPEMILTVLAHEALHPALSHLWRRGTRDPLLWNISTDAVVNSILEQNGFHLSNNFVKRLPEWADLPEEVIYERLKRRAKAAATAFALQGDMLEPAKGAGANGGRGTGKPGNAGGADDAQRAQDVLAAAPGPRVPRGQVPGPRPRGRGGAHRRAPVPHAGLARPGSSSRPCSTTTGCGPTAACWTPTTSTSPPCPASGSRTSCATWTRPAPWGATRSARA